MYHHLRYNHFPPIDLGWAPIAEAAIEAAQRDDWDAVLPAGPNGNVLTVHQVVEGLHLEFFIEWEEE